MRGGLTETEGNKEGNRLTARRDNLYPFCLCQDEGREERNPYIRGTEKQVEKQSDERE